MPRLLASVATPDEAALALELGADILDLKNPAEGALGAWPLDALRAAVVRFGGRRPLSATTGDLLPVPNIVVPRAEATGATGVDFVKVGLFAGGNLSALVAALAPVARRCRLVAVMMADQAPDFGLVPRLAEAGFAGAMLDTADKRRGGLRAHLSDRVLAKFVASARARGMLCGVAGSLGVDDIGPLTAIGPDYLGFRGALCAGGREGAFDPTRFAGVRRALGAVHAPGARTSGTAALAG